MGKRKPIIAREKDSIMMKALVCLGRQKTYIVKMTQNKIIAKVEGDHSNNPDDRDAKFSEKEPYTVTIRKDGSHSCSCQALIYASKKSHETFQYHQFWGQDPNTDIIRLVPECSHVIAIKLTYDYKKWIIHDDIIEKWRKKADIDPTITDYMEKATEEINEIARHEPDVKSVIRTSGIKTVPHDPTDLDNITINRKRRKIDLMEDLKDL